MFHSDTIQEKREPLLKTYAFIVLKKMLFPIQLCSELLRRHHLKCIFNFDFQVSSSGIKSVVQTEELTGNK